MIMKPDPYGRPSEQYPGIYRGTIENVSDPEQRRRFRVRVGNIHPQEVESDHLPWAEVGSLFVGGSFGDIPSFEVDDPVWVMFEGGDRRFPVIMGGVLNFSGGLPPLPSEQTGDYDRLAKRWVRIDRAGNKIELSSLDEEQWVKLATPDGSHVQVSARDGTIELRAEGRVNIVCVAANVTASERVNVTTTQLLADVVESATVRCRGVTNIRAAGEINIGEYEPEDVSAVPTPPETTPVINIKAASTVKIESAGVLDVDSAGETQITSASRIVVAAANDITIETDANLSITVAGDATLEVTGDLGATVEGNATLDVTGTTTLTGQQKVEVTGGAEIEVSSASSFLVQAGATFRVNGDATVEIVAAASMSLTASGQLSLHSDSMIELTAPSVKIDAESIAELLAGSIVRVNSSGLIQIG